MRTLGRTIGERAATFSVNVSRLIPGPIPWPFDPAQAISEHVSSPWLTAIASVVAGTLSGADIEGSDEAKAALDELRFFWGYQQISFAEYIRLAVFFLEATGNLFCEVTDDGSISTLPVDGVTAYLDGQGIAIRHNSPYGEVAYRPFKDGDPPWYIHVGYPHPLSSFYGLPPWVGARDAVALDRAHRQYLAQFFQNMASPRYIVQVTMDENWGKTPPTEEEADAVFELIADYLSNPRSTGRNLVVRHPGGIKIVITPMDAKTDDPTYAQLANQVRGEILAARHIHPLALGLVEGAYRATASEQTKLMADNLLWPTSRLVMKPINAVLSSMGLGEVGLILDDTAALLEQVEAIVKATGTPILSPDEGRSLLGYEPRGLGAVYLPANLIPEGWSGNEPE